MSSQASRASGIPGTFSDPAAPRRPGDPDEPLLDLREARSILHVADSDHSLDDQIAAYIAAAVDRLNTELEPYADASPPLPGTRTWQAARNACRYFFLSVWMRDHAQIELAKAHRAEFDAAILALKKAIVADKPPRRESLLVSRDRDLDDRIYEPAAMDQYLAREFL